MLSVKQLDEMSRIEISKADISGLVDIRTVNIDTTLPVAERMENYLEQIKNPYCFLYGGTRVKIRFDPQGKDMTCKLKNFFVGLKAGDLQSGTR